MRRFQISTHFSKMARVRLAQGVVPPPLRNRLLFDESTRTQASLCVSPDIPIHINPMTKPNASPPQIPAIAANAVQTQSHSGGRSQSDSATAMVVSEAIAAAHVWMDLKRQGFVIGLMRWTITIVLSTACFTESRDRRGKHPFLNESLTNSQHAIQYYVHCDKSLFASA